MITHKEIEEMVSKFKDSLGSPLNPRNYVLLMNTEVYESLGKQDFGVDFVCNSNIFPKDKVYLIDKKYLFYWAETVALQKNEYKELRMFLDIDAK